MTMLHRWAGRIRRFIHAPDKRLWLIEALHAWTDRLLPVMRGRVQNRLLDRHVAAMRRGRQA